MDEIHAVAFPHSCSQVTIAQSLKLQPENGLLAARTSLMDSNCHSIHEPSFSVTMRSIRDVLDIGKLEMYIDEVRLKGVASPGDAAHTAPPQQQVNGRQMAVRRQCRYTRTCSTTN